MAVLSPAEQRASREGRLAAEVELPSGRIKRWGPDEASTADILEGLEFTTSDPGGFKDSNFGLARSIDTNWPDLSLLLPVRIYGSGQRTAWEGRLQERPGRHGTEDEISPGSVGWQAHLADRQFQEIYIDSDVTKWGDPPNARKVILNGATSTGAGPNLMCIETTTGPGPTGAPGIQQKLGNVLASRTPIGEAWYYGNGIDLGQIILSAIARSGGVDANFGTFFDFSADESGAVLGAGIPNFQFGNHPEEYGSSIPAAGFKYAFFQMYYAASLPTNNYTNLYEWETVKVLGRSGIPMIGTWPSIGPAASSVIADIVRRFAPKLNFTTGAEGSIQPTAYPIPQAAFTDAIKPSDAIAAMNAYHQYSWGVEDDRTFFFRPTSTFRKRWRIRRSKGDGVELLGPQAEAAVNGVIVSFTDPSGVSRTVGPPEYSTAYTTSTFLRDLNPLNPVNLAGGGQKWGELTLGFVTDVAGAVQIGAEWLQAQLLSASARGSVTVTGVVQDENGAFWPAWAMRAGDSATVVDGDGIERRIIESSYSADGRVCNCSLDSTPHTLEAKMEQMGIAVAGL